MSVNECKRRAPVREVVSGQVQVARFGALMMHTFCQLDQNVIVNRDFHVSLRRIWRFKFVVVRRRVNILDTAANSRQRAIAAIGIIVARTAQA